MTEEKRIIGEIPLAEEVQMQIKQRAPVKPETALKQSLRKGSLPSLALMKQFSKCSTCPLGERVIEVMVNDKRVTKIIPARCPFYQATREKCVYTHQEQALRLKTFYEIEQKSDTMELQKSLMYQTLIDAEMARKTETLTQGAPGQLTKEFTELAHKQLESYNKQKYGQKNVNVDIAAHSRVPIDFRNLFAEPEKIIEVDSIEVQDETKEDEEADKEE